MDLGVDWDAVAVKRVRVCVALVGVGIVFFLCLLML